MISTPISHSSTRSVRAATFEAPPTLSTLPKLTSEPSFNIIAHYSDRKALITDADRAVFNLIITKSLSNLGSSISEALDTLDVLRSIGVEFYFTELKLYASDDAFAVVRNGLERIAESELKRKADLAHAYLEKRSQLGDPVTVSCYGYTKEWAVNENEAKRVKTAFYLASQCATYLDIRDVLNDMEETDHTGLIWTHHKLHYLLLNERYTGILLTNKNTRVRVDGAKRMVRNKGGQKQYYFEKHHAPLVGGKTFEMVCEAVKEGYLKSKARFNMDSEFVKRMSEVGASDPLLAAVLCV